MKTAKQILDETRHKYAAALADKRYCFDLADDEITTGGSLLADLSSDAGYDSLRSYLNTGNTWSKKVGTVAEWLIERAAMAQAEAQNVGTWDDLDSFLADANA